jgi:hypothetical protein
MKNFDYDKVIITKYLIGGGGKFLCACLGLSDDVVLMQKDLAQMQLDGKLPIEKKLKYLLLATKQQSEKQIWDDWGLLRFWGVLDFEYSIYSKEYIIDRINKVVYNCIDNNKFMFLTVHEDSFLIPILNYWKNSKVIIFKNEQEFAPKRTLGKFGINRMWPPDEEPRCRMPIITSSCSISKLQLDRSRIDNLSYEWDCDWYYSRDKTVDEIEKLYDSFGLSGFNAEMISEFYEAWRNAIKL